MFYIIFIDIVMFLSSVTYFFVGFYTFLAYFIVKHRKMAPGKRRKNYTEDELAEAVEALNNGMSGRQCEEQFGIPRKTISDRASGLHGSKIGQPAVLSDEEEAMMVDMILLMSKWGFPFSGDDLRYFVKAYLDKKGKTALRFKMNLPTHRWVVSFLGRHKSLTLRTSNPIKRSRAAVSREEVGRFFDQFMKSVDGVPPENIVNYDETNFRDDLRLRKCITRKGTKYCETVVNTSKQEYKKNKFAFFIDR